MSPHKMLHTRKCFYVTGTYQDAALNGSSERGSMMQGQMYVEELRPEAVTRKYPIVFWPGACTTGSCWVTCPDGRPGWASYFLHEGYVLYLVDPPDRGRSALTVGIEKPRNIDDQYVENFWTATKESEQLWPQAKLHTQWPGSGRRGDEIFDNFMASLVQSRTDILANELLAQKVGSSLLQKIGPAILCVHSQAGSYGWLLADAVPHLVKSVVALEPLGPPFVNRIASIISSPNVREVKRPFGITTAPISYDPPLSHPNELRTKLSPAPHPHLCDIILQMEPARTIPNLSEIPVLVVTGESGYHAHYDHATVAYLRQAGVAVEHLDLSKEGVPGNGHFMFLEKNNIQIATLMENWLAKFN